MLVINDVISVNYSTFDDYIVHIYSIELENKKKSIDTFNLPHILIDITQIVKIGCKNIHENRDDYRFPIVNFAFFIHIQIASAYGIYTYIS